MEQNKTKQLETVAVDCVYSLSQSETRRYKLAEKYFIAEVRVYCKRTKYVVLLLFNLILF